MAYTKNFRPTYPNGWKDLPSKDTPVLASTLTGYDTAITEIEDELVENDAIRQQLESKKASLESPVFTGIPKAPTAPSGNSTTQIATTAFTQTAVSGHNTSGTAHDDIRNLISGLTARLNALADSDDTTLDQLSEIVTYIKSNRTLIENITTNKINVADIIDNLTSTATNKPLSAKQGKVLKDLIDTITTTVGDKVDKVSGKGLSTNDYTTAEKNKLSGIASGAEVNVQADWNVTDTENDAYIKNKPAIPSYDIYGAEEISLGREGVVGKYSVAVGYNVNASGTAAFSSGNFCSASGYSATAQGSDANASGAAAVAQGSHTKAIGDVSHAMGFCTEAGYDYQTVMGKYNHNNENNLLEVGNGYAENVENEHRSNALELDVDGNLTVAGQITDGNGAVLRDMQWKCVNPTGTVGAGWIDLPDIDSGEIWVITTSEADATGYRAMQQTSFPAGFASLNMAVVEGSYLNAAWGVYIEWITLEKRIHLNTFRRTLNSTAVDLKSTATTWVYYR